LLPELGNSEFDYDISACHLLLFITELLQEKIEMQAESHRLSSSPAPQDKQHAMKKI